MGAGFARDEDIVEIETGATVLDNGFNVSTGVSRLAEERTEIDTGVEPL